LILAVKLDRDRLSACSRDVAAAPQGGWSRAAAAIMPYRYKMAIAALWRDGYLTNKKNTPLLICHKSKLNFQRCIA
jgi:hypothetical protein